MKITDTNVPFQTRLRGVWCQACNMYWMYLYMYLFPSAMVCHALLAKCIYGMNTKLESMSQLQISFKFFSAFWEDSDGYKVMPESYAAKSFILGPEVASPSLFIKYIQGLRAAMVRASTTVVDMYK